MIRTRLAIGLTAVALLGFSACSSDSVASKVQDAAASETTIASSSGGDNATSDTAAPGQTLPAGAGGAIAGMLPEKCRAVYSAFLGAIGAAMGTGEKIDFDQIFGDTKAELPDQVQQDITFLAGVYGEFSKQMEGKQNDPAAAAQALQVLSDPKVQEASDRINSYFETTCPQG